METVRRMVVLLVVAIVVSQSLACQKQAAQAAIPGQVNTFDGQTFRALADAQAFLTTLVAQVTAGKLTLTPNQTVLFNNVASEYNVCQGSYQVYHATALQGKAPDATALATAISQLNADVASLASQLGGK